MPVPDETASAIATSAPASGERGGATPSASRPPLLGRSAVLRRNGKRRARAVTPSRVQSKRNTAGLRSVADDRRLRRRAVEASPYRSSASGASAGRLAKRIGAIIASERPDEAAVAGLDARRQPLRIVGERHEVGVRPASARALKTRRIPHVGTRGRDRTGRSRAPKRRRSGSAANRERIGVARTSIGVGPEGGRPLRSNARDADRGAGNGAGEEAPGG